MTPSAWIARGTAGGIAPSLRRMSLHRFPSPEEAPSDD